MLSENMITSFLSCLLLHLIEKCLNICRFRRLYLTQKSKEQHKRIKYSHLMANTKKCETKLLASIILLEKSAYDSIYFERRDACFL